MRISAKVVKRVQSALNCDYLMAEQLLRETNTVQEAIELGRMYQGG